MRSDTNLKFDSKATKIQFSFAPRRIQGPIKFRYDTWIKSPRKVPFHNWQVTEFKNTMYVLLNFCYLINVILLSFILGEKDWESNSPIAVVPLVPVITCIINMTGFFYQSHICGWPGKFLAEGGVWAHCTDRRTFTGPIHCQAKCMNKNFVSQEK